MVRFGGQKIVPNRIRIGLVGVGKIARDQHLPALANDRRFELVAAASRHGSVDGVANFHSIEELIAGTPDLHAVTLCTPPNARTSMAHAAIAAGLHVMLEKPPAPTVSAAHALARNARARGVTLFATWHSREAAAVQAARTWLTERVITAVRIEWKEDVRKWHPGQDWIWEPGGFGVFDPGINALSILTRILPSPVSLQAATLSFPENRGAPIAAELHMTHAPRAPVEAVFDFREPGGESWTIEVHTDAGALRLSEGGARLQIDGRPVEQEGNREYPALYKHFAHLIDAADSDVDLAPLQLVADAFLCGRRVTVERFDD
jgi:D-galactose 1-dehydrogenase